MPRPRWRATKAAAALLLLAHAQMILTTPNKPTTSAPLKPSTCPSQSINYITQTLPQQCLTTSWASRPSTQNTIIYDAATSSSSRSHTSLHDNFAKPATSDAIVSSVEVSVPTQPSSTFSTDYAEIRSSSSIAEPATSAEAITETAQEIETESPLDNANFLSFEEWKRRNLAKAGQSAENLGARAVGGQEQRKRPGSINNALDSLGEDAEIDIDFGGFVNRGPINDAPSGQTRMQGIPQADFEKVQPDEAAKPDTGTRRRSKDAGKTCKERTNYASYDCAATTLKTNPQCKSPSAVLVENKDSYMLNICSVQNKFLIVELCDAILIDTIVLANFEFFSSMFRTFRVSVSDRYPVKLDKWREIGTYEARNSRGVQAFLVENPLIWASYLRVEFLTHYGNEYYCPVSLLRAHGTTMMEEFNSEVKNAGMVEDLEIDEVMPESGQGVEATPAVISAEVLKTSPQIGAEQLHETSATIGAKTTLASGRAPSSTPGPLTELSVSTDLPSSLRDLTARNISTCDRLRAILTAVEESRLVCPAEDQPLTASLTASSDTSSAKEARTSGSKTSEVSSAVITLSASRILNETLFSNSTSKSTNAMSPTSQEAVSTSSASQNATNAPSSSANSTSPSATNIQTSSTQPPASNPTTQESFFKSVHKRLQLLEANSSLSLQYIEEQSRILRDAFSKVEKRQLTKTSTFLETLNTTVLTELHEFRMQYDQIWQSTVLELSSQREKSQREVFALSTRLSLLADEIIFQKRMAILQFLLILLCLGLVIFSKHGSAATYLELPPLVQNAINKSSANLSRYAPHFDTPPASPSASRPPSRYGIFRGFSHRQTPSEESYAHPGHKSPSIERSPPTPESQRSVAGDADSSPRRSQKGESSDDPPEADEEVRPKSAPGPRNAKIL